MGARALRAVSGLLEWYIFLLLVGSVAAIGSVHEWAYVPLWWATAGLSLLVAARAALIVRLRQRLGLQRFAFHTSGRWLVLDDDSPYGMRTWGFDLGRPLVPVGPLLVPGLLLVGWGLFQLLNLPPRVAAAINITQPLGGVATGDQWRPLTVSVVDTVRGLGFVAMVLMLHLASAAAFDRRESRSAFLGRLRFLGLVLSLAALAQLASGTRLIYGVFQPIEDDGNANIFGPFVNRNHFAAYMLMLTPLALGWLVTCLRGLSRDVGRSANVRRVAVNVLQRSGAGLIYAGLPALAMVSALLATTSRGALIAFAGGLILASLRLARRSEVPAWAVVLLLFGVALTWFGLDRLESRFVRISDNAPGRTQVWKESLRRMDAHWVTGYGLNTFQAAVTRTTAWALPVGATPWMDPFETSIAEVERAGYRTFEKDPGLTWYREAHNDYLQLLTEVGVPGLMIALWGVFLLIRRVRRDAWLLAAVAGPLLHAFVEFGFQIPAVAALFAVVSAIRPNRA
jgi:O-antigen ligase